MTAMIEIITTDWHNVFKSLSFSPFITQELSIKLSVDIFLFINFQFYSIRNSSKSFSGRTKYAPQDISSYFHAKTQLLFLLDKLLFISEYSQIRYYFE